MAIIANLFFFEFLNIFVRYIDKKCKHHLKLTHNCEIPRLNPINIFKLLKDPCGRLVLQNGEAKFHTELDQFFRYMFNQ